MNENKSVAYFVLERLEMGNNMQKRFVRRMCSVVFIFMMLMPYTRYMAVHTTKTYGDTTTEINKAKDNQAKIDEKLKDTQDELSDLRKQSADTQTYINQLDAKLGLLDNNIYDLNTQIQQLNNDIEEAKQGLEKAEIDSDLQYQAMKLRIQFMYEHNDESYLDILLASSSLADMLNKADYISKISEYDRQKLVEYEQIITYIAQTKQKLEADYAALDERKNAVEEQRKVLAVVQSTKEQELKSLNKQVSATQVTMSQLEKDKLEQENALLELIAKKDREDEEARKAEESRKKAELENKNSSSNSSNSSNSGSDATPSSSGFIWPTISKRITSRFGDTEYRASPHRGLDIGAVTPGTTGDPIYAAADGEVISASYHYSMGNYVIISHGNGLNTVYMHASSLKVSVGDRVSQGQVIMLMGSTGDSTGPHLHFGVVKNGTYVNPLNYISP